MLWDAPGCIWTDVQAEPSILDPTWAILGGLGPNQHFGPSTHELTLCMHANTNVELGRADVG